MRTIMMDEEDNHHKTTGTETETEMDNDSHMTKMVAAVAHGEGEDEHGTRTEGAGNRYSAIQRGTQKGPKRAQQRLLGHR
jgi:hypothetical protein